jgi:hypothetical protein
MFGFEFYLLFGVIAVVVAWTMATNGFKWFKQYRLKRQRKGQDRNTFIRYFVVEGIPEAVIVAVYRYFQKLQWVKNFPVSPEDNIEEVYGLRDEDLTEAIVEIAQTCRYSIPPENSPVWSQAYIFSIEDLIRFIYSLSESSQGEAAG